MNKSTLTVASSMSGKTYDYLCEKIKERFGSDTEIVRVDDDGVIGGFILSLNGEIYDLSISSQLSLIKKHIKGER